jgi:hypothetical protein
VVGWNGGPSQVGTPRAGGSGLRVPTVKIRSAEGHPPYLRHPPPTFHKTKRGAPGEEEVSRETGDRRGRTDSPPGWN